MAYCLLNQGNGLYANCLNFRITVYAKFYAASLPLLKRPEKMANVSRAIKNEKSVWYLAG